MKLSRYDEIQESDYLDYIAEWEESGERIVPAATERRARDFGQVVEAWRLREAEETCGKGKVPATLYFLVGETGGILGAIDFRHRLNEELLFHGGHIGYGVRPSERRKGYCSTMLAMLLAELRRLGLGKVLLTCDDDNIGSFRTIEGAGGRLENKVLYEGKLARRYWIEL